SARSASILRARSRRSRNSAEADRSSFASREWARQATRSAPAPRSASAKVRHSIAISLVPETAPILTGSVAFGQAARSVQSDEGEGEREPEARAPAPASGAVLFEAAGVGEQQAHQIPGREGAEVADCRGAFGEARGAVDESDRRGQQQRHRMEAVSF